MIKGWINSIWNHIVRKQSLSIDPNGGFICETNGKKHHIDDLLEGLTECLDK